MIDAPNLSEFSIVRLNSELFPVSEFEQESYDRFGMQPTCLEASGAGITKHAADCDALLVVSESLPAEVIDSLQRCRVISRLGAGTDKIDRDAATRNGIVITNVPNFCHEEQADHAMALLLALVRKLPQMHQSMLAGKWDTGRNQCRSIRRFENRVLGLLGFGGSAKALARRAKGFGLRILANRRRIDVVDPEADVLGVEITDADTVIRESDYLSLHLPLNDDTRHLLNAERLASMKPGAYLINTARGAIIDETALADALRSGHLAGAGLDTFFEINVHGSDGTPPTHPLLGLENAVLTPHVAGFSKDSARDVGTGGVDNVAAVLNGRWPPMERVVNREVVPRVALDRCHGKP
jgi:D-3-phosphoglycerate dehydrogenase